MTTKKATIFLKILTRNSRIAYSHRFQSRHLWRVHLEKQPASLNLWRRLSSFLTQGDLSWVSPSTKFIQLFRNIFFVSDTTGQPRQQLSASKYRGEISKEMQPWNTQVFAIFSCYHHIIRRNAALKYARFRHFFLAIITLITAIILIAWHSTATTDACCVGIHIIMYRMEQRKRMFFKWLVLGKAASVV